MSDSAKSIIVKNEKSLIMYKSKRQIFGYIPKPSHDIFY